MRCTIERPNTNKKAKKDTLMAFLIFSPRNVQIRPDSQLVVVIDRLVAEVKIQDLVFLVPLASTQKGTIIVRQPNGKVSGTDHQNIKLAVLANAMVISAASTSLSPNRCRVLSIRPPVKDAEAANTTDTATRGASPSSKRGRVMASVINENRG